MTEPRYVVVTVTGYPVTQGSTSYGSRKQTTSFSVCDTAHNYREVYTEYANEHNKYVGRSRRAHEECARLNALEEADELQHASAAA